MTPAQLESDGSSRWQPIAARVVQFMSDLGEQLRKDGLASEYHSHAAHDIHGFYQLAHYPSLVLHVQAYPRMSTTTELHVLARLMDKEKMLQARKCGSVSIGNEHSAVVLSLPSFAGGITVSWKCADLSALIRADIDNWIEAKIHR